MQHKPINARTVHPSEVYKHAGALVHVCKYTSPYAHIHARTYSVWYTHTARTAAMDKARYTKKSNDKTRIKEEQTERSFKSFPPLLTPS